MHHFHQYADLDPLYDTQPELWRELYGYMAVCRKELEDYGDPDDDVDFCLATEDDDLTDLDDPEEWVLISIHSSDSTYLIYRIVFVSHVLFVPEHLSAQLSFL